MSNHTPGPWTAAHSTPAEGFDAWEIEHHPNGMPTLIASIPDTFNKRSENAANAHLIAAAPDMYEALQFIYAVASPDNERLSDKSAVAIFKKARAALAKAEGRS